MKRRHGLEVLGGMLSVCGRPLREASEVLRRNMRDVLKTLSTKMRSTRHRQAGRTPCKVGVTQPGPRNSQSRSQAFSRVLSIPFRGRMTLTTFDPSLLVFRPERMTSGGFSCHGHPSRHV